MAAKNRRVKVIIDEKEYTIISNKSVAHIKLVAETINKQLKELSTLSNKLTKEEQAILMAINAISDQIDSHTKMIDLKKNLNK